MTVSRRRVAALVRKELREYRRNRSIVAGMSIIPLIFLVQPAVSVFTTAASAARPLSHRHELLYLLGIPALVPATLAAYAVVGERQQGTLEPLLGTPIRREEILLAKALAVLVPSVGVSYLVYGVFLACVELFAEPPVAHALVRVPDVAAQVIFTPLVAAWSIWLCVAISTRTSDIRVAQQLSVFASFPSITVTTLVSLNTIHATLSVAIGFGAGLLVANRLGWRISSALLDRERLITGLKQ